MKNLLVGLLLLAQGITQSGTGSGSIVGRILNPDGSPAVGVRVAASAVRSNSAEPNRNSASLSPTQTDNAGRYRLEHIPAGRFYVTVGTVESPDYFIVTVSDGVSQEAQDFQWRGVGPALALAIRGRVTDDNGTLVLKPARGAGRGVTSFEELRLTRNGVLTAAVPSLGGNFQFRNLRPGRYLLTVEPNFANVPPIEVVLVDKDMDSLQIRIDKSFVTTTTLRGTLQVEGGGVRPALRLVVTSTIRGAGPRTYSVSDPTFSFPEIAFGEYNAEVQNLPAGYSVKSMTAGTTDLLSEKLRLTATNSPQIAIVLGVSSPPPWVPVHGVLTGRDTSRPLPSSVTLTGTTGGGLATALILPDGSFEFPMVLPGTYNALLTPVLDSLTRTITVGKSNPANVEIRMSIPAVKVSGRVVGEDRMREQGRLGANEFFQLVLSASAGSPIRSVRSANGTFEFPPLQPGTYQLILEKTCTGCDSKPVSSDNGTTFVVTDKDMTDLVISVNR